jgi:hypothetical protein
VALALPVAGGGGSGAVAIGVGMGLASDRSVRAGLLPPLGDAAHAQHVKSAMVASNVRRQNAITADPRTLRTGGDRQALGKYKRQST